MAKTMLETIIGVIVGIIFVVIIIFVISSLIKTQLPKEIDDATLSSFDEIVRVVESISEDDLKSVAVDIRDPFAIVGIIDDNIIINNVEFKHRYYYAKFSLLNNPCEKACLCICNYDRSNQVLKDNACLKDKCVEIDIDGFSGWGASDDKKYLFLEGRSNIKLDKLYSMKVSKKDNIINFERIFSE